MLVFSSFGEKGHRHLQFPETVHSLFLSERTNALPITEVL